MREYYYLDGLDKKGPFSKDELINLGLNDDDLIWTEGFENWKSYRDTKEIINTLSNQLPSEIVTKTGIFKKSRKVINLILFIFTLFLFSIIITFILIESIKVRSKNELTQKIDGIFGEKSVVCDGVNYAVKGKLSTIEELTIPNTKNKKLQFKDKNDLLSQLMEDHKAIEELGNLRKEGLVEKFICETGGFTFKKIKKVDNGFELEVLTSTDMGFKSSSYNRGTIQEAYNFAYDYIKNENSGCYSNSLYDLIGNFKFLEDRFYLVDNIQKPSYPNTHYWWSENDGGIFDDYRVVYYKSEGWYYEIKPKKEEIKDSFLKILFIGTIISILISAIIFVFNPFKW